jgi:two-component system sensor histidine kinase/response regulator
VEKKNKILIVDDNEDTVELLKKRFRAEGYETAEAYDGEEGLKKVVDYNPDLVVLDVMMPKMDGYEVCQRLKLDENTRYIPVIMLTAKSDVASKVRGLDIGADDYLPKPFDYKELSARVRSLLTIKAAREKLAEEEKSGALEQMMDQVAHEIRNPLTSIGGFARKVYGKLPEGDPNRKYMEMIVDDVAILENMIKQLIELKTMTVSFKEPTNINKVILKALKVFEQEFQQKAIDVETELMDNLPLIPADDKLLKRALCNLIKNSIEAMDEGTKALKIASRLSGGHIEILITDKLKNIFDPLVTSKVYGPGLGLTFALKIIQDHKGTISVDSEPGKGTTFTISFPVEKL